MRGLAAANHPEVVRRLEAPVEAEHVTGSSAAIGRARQGKNRAATGVTRYRLARESEQLSGQTSPQMKT